MNILSLNSTAGATLEPAPTVVVRVNGELVTLRLGVAVAGVELVEIRRNLLKKPSPNGKNFYRFHLTDGTHHDEYVRSEGVAVALFTKKFPGVEYKSLEIL